MYYKIYTDIRDAAWQCLIDNNIDSLPVDVLKIARQSNIDVKKNSRIKILLSDEYAKAFYNGEKWIIVYNDRNDVPVSRFAIAHELGHILLGHVKTYAKYATIEDIGIKPKAENQADTFALRLLCPACILMELDLHSPEEISAFCRVPTHLAQKRSDRMKELYKKNKFFSNNLEIEIRKNFNIYLSATKENQRKDPVWHSSKNE
ncbi:MAG: ImmA/IrrE family metallo-endopeptidase [Ruminococcaceae bacterium]|nr:ImmA/IrrE family metallo-endopeptidase [Oscillospiraceae bacterium]